MRGNILASLAIGLILGAAYVWAMNAIPWAMDREIATRQSVSYLVER